jgi:hypothetical protein
MEVASMMDKDLRYLFTMLVLFGLESLAIWLLAVASVAIGGLAGVLVVGLVIVPGIVVVVDRWGKGGRQSVGGGK